MASNTQNPSPANASAKTAAAPKPAAKTTRAKTTPRTQAARTTAKTTAKTAADKESAPTATNGTNGSAVDADKANGTIVSDDKGATTATAPTSTTDKTATADQAAEKVKPTKVTTPKATPTAAAPTTPAPTTPAPTTAARTTETPTTAAPATATPTANGSGHSVIVTIPITVDQLVAATMTVAKLPTTVIRRVVSTRNGLPVYLGIGGLAVAGVAEWPFAAAAGAGYAALRRWGPLRRESGPAAGSAEQPTSAPRSAKKSAPVAEQVTIDDDAASAS